MIPQGTPVIMASASHFNSSLAQNHTRLAQDTILSLMFSIR